MVVLKIIGVIVGALFLFGIYVKINIYTYEKYKYEFLNNKNLVKMTIGNGISIFGYILFSDALRVNGDYLNGLIILVIGFILIATVLYDNYKHTPWYIAILFSLFEIAYCMFLLIIGLLLFGVIAALSSETKPVYTINK